MLYINLHSIIRQFLYGNFRVSFLHFAVLVFIIAVAFIFLFCIILKIRRKYDTIKRDIEQLSQKIKEATDHNNNLVEERISLKRQISTLEAKNNTLNSSAKVYQEKVKQLDKDCDLLQKENTTISNTLEQTSEELNEKELYANHLANQLSESNARLKEIENKYAKLKTDLDEKVLLADHLVQKINDYNFNSKELEDKYTKLKKELEEKEKAYKLQCANLVIAKRTNGKLEKMNNELIAEIEKLKQDCSDFEKELDEKRAFLKHCQDFSSNPFERLAKW